MSAERQVFKQLTALGAEREEFLQVWNSAADVLIQNALREFMRDHPEVKSLHFCAGGPTVQVRFPINNQLYGAPELAPLHPQLSKCMEALGSHLWAFRDRIMAVFGPEPVEYRQPGPLPVPTGSPV